MGPFTVASLLVGGAGLWAGSAAGALEIVFHRPHPGEPAFGQVEVALGVQAQGPVEVELWVDGEAVALLDRPPYRTLVDVGWENEEHRFRAIARAGPETRTATLLTPMVDVDLEVTVELHQLYVTVTSGGEPVTGLAREDFTVFDDGDRQRIVTFGGGDLPVSAVLLVDSSRSMSGGRLETAVLGAAAFVERMQPLDEAMLILFSDGLVRSTPFTGDREVVSGGLDGLVPSGGTALNDALYVALKRVSGRHGRQVVILLSDGVDAESVLRMEDVRWLLRRSQVVLYWIRLGGAPSFDRQVTHRSAWRSAAGHEAERRLLEEQVVETGGRILDLETIEDAELAFGEILREMRTQYVLGYYPSNSADDGSWHPIRVQVKGGGSVRTRRGYADD